METSSSKRKADDDDSWQTLKRRCSSESCESKNDAIETEVQSIKNSKGHSTEDITLSEQSTSGEIFAKSDVKAKDDPHQVPRLSVWAEMAQRELDTGQSLHIEGIHTVVCIDISDSMKHGDAWGQTRQFFTQFIQGLEEVKETVDEEYVALSVFGQEVKVVQRLTNEYIQLQHAFNSLKLGGPTPLYGGLLMALAGVASLSVANAKGVKIYPRVILVTDGHPTDPLLISGSDDHDPVKEKKHQVTTMQAVDNISSKKIRIDCIPVGEADLAFLDLLATRARGKVYSYNDGRKLARRVINSCHAGYILSMWEMMNFFPMTLGREISLDAVMDMTEAHQISSLPQEEREEVLEIAKKALQKYGISEENKNVQNYNLEFDDPDVNLPPLGTRVRRGPDWNRGPEDDSGPGTITGHHKNKRQVYVTWDKKDKSDIYCYGDKGKYDVKIVDEPRVLRSDELIATGCHVRRGRDWIWGDQDGEPGNIGVVIKVQDDGLVWLLHIMNNKVPRIRVSSIKVRWPDKRKNVYRFGINGKFDLEICPVESQTEGMATDPEHPFIPESGGRIDDVSFSGQASLKTSSMERIVEKNGDCTNATVITTSQSSSTQITVPATLSTIMMPTSGTSITPTTSIMMETTSAVTSNTQTTSESKSSLITAPVMATLSETSTTSEPIMSLDTATSQTTILYERTSGPPRTPEDARHADHLDLNAPVSRVHTNYWEMLAQKEIVEAQMKNTIGIHTLICVDTSASMRLGSAWHETQHFFNDFINELKRIQDTTELNEEQVALYVFGQEVKGVQRLSKNFSDLKNAFGALKLGGPTPMYGGLLMALAGFSNAGEIGSLAPEYGGLIMALAGITSISLPAVNGIQIPPRIILITDGHLTDTFLAAGPDVHESDKKAKSDVMKAVKNISRKKISIYCVPVGDADESFLRLLAKKTDGQIVSYKDGRKLAGRTINTLHAGLVLQQWKSMNEVGKSFGTEMSLEDVMDMPVAHQIATLSPEEKIEVLNTAKRAVEKDLVAEDIVDEREEYHYEFDDPNVNLPPLGTRVRRDTDWDRDLHDGDGPGTIIGHHKTNRQVHVEWDKDGKSDFYRYGDGKYDVKVVNEPRVLQSDELIATGCHVRRGKDWMWGNQGGTSSAVGVVIKVRDDDWIWVRWPDKTKNMYRFGADGCFDLDICDPSGNPVRSMTVGETKQPRQISPPLQQPNQSVTLPQIQTLMKEFTKMVQNEMGEFYEFDDPDIKLPSLGTRVRRGPDWNWGLQDGDGPGTIIGHHKIRRAVLVEWDNNGKCGVYRYDDREKQDVLVVHEPRVLQSNERIATGCHVKRGPDWKWKNQDGTPGTEGVVIKVQKDGFVWVRWPDKSKNIYRFGHNGRYDLEVCNPVESQTARVVGQTGHPYPPHMILKSADVPLSGQSQNMEMSETAEETAGATIMQSLPPEILHMDEHGQKLFRKALEAGKVEVHNIRVMIVGQEGVGKTTLTQRIQGVEITETHPTKGINVHTGCCRIDHDTKEWSAAKREQLSSAEESLFYGIYNYVNKNKEEMKISIQQEQQRFSIIESQSLLFVTSNPGENQAVSGVNVIPTDLDNVCRIDDGDRIEKRNIVLDQNKPESNQNFPNEANTVDAIVKKRSDSIRCSSSLSEFNKFVEWGKANKYSVKKFSNVTVLDFAGQFLYYTSHQVFMSGHTLYLLVTDISKPLSDIIEGSTFGRDMNENKGCSIQDYVIYWMNSIFSHGKPVNGYSQSFGGTIQQKEDTEIGQEKAVDFKPVLLVATHLDEISKEERENKMTAYFKTVEDALRGRPFIHLIEGTIAVGNFGSDMQSDIVAVRRKIFEMAKKQPYWKYPVPTTWLALEEKLMEERERKPIIHLSELGDLNKSGGVPINEEELEVFLRFEHNLGNILYFRTEKLKQKIILDPVWLIDGLQILHSSELSAIQAGRGVKQCSPKTADDFDEFKKTGRLTQSLIGYLWSEKEDERFHQNQEYLLDVMEEMDIIVQPVEKEKNLEKYYWVPCMIQDSAPDNVKNPGPSKKMSDFRTRTSTLCFVSKTRFIHVGVFHRLVASCLSKWLPAKEGKKYQLYRGCCLFTVSEDGCHQLLLALNDYVIQATVIRITSEADEPMSDICIEIRKFIYTTLSDIAACICPNSEFDVYIKCDRSSINTTEGLLEFSSKREISCNCSKPTHPVMLQNELKFWEQREGKLPTKLDPINDEGDKIRFNRISLLLVGVGTRVLRRLLNHYVAKKYRSFDEFLQNKEADIRKIPHMTKAMKDLLYPGGGTPSDRRAYDITLASALLTNMLISPNDVQEWNAVTGIRDDRNKYHAHASSVRMNSQDYTKHWERITQNLDILIKVCDDPDFEYDMLAEIGSIQKSGQPELNSRLMKCEEDISKLYSMVTVSV